MKKGMFDGWQDVFSFTLKQSLSQKFKNVTVIIALVMLAIGFSISVIMAVVQQKSATEVSEIETVYLVDETGLDLLMLQAMDEVKEKSFPKLVFEESDKDYKELAKTVGQEKKKDVILHLFKAGEGYKISVILPYGTEITKKDAENLEDAFRPVMEQSKIVSSGVAPEKLLFVLSPDVPTLLEAGESEKSLGEEMMVMLTPMICTLVIYMMVFIYGTSMGNIVSVEKSSKLMEMLLTLTRPYGIITGKILATVLTAIGQFLIWVACVPVGFFGGHYVAKTMIYPEYTNVLMEVVKGINAQGAASAFTPVSVALAVFTICLAFVFFCVLAAMVASFASKSDELSQVMSIYQILVVFCFMGAYIIPTQDIAWLKEALRFVPFTGAFLLPGELLVGSITTGKAILCIAILLVATLAVILLAGKLYYNQLFYRGKNIIEVLFGKTVKKQKGKE